MEVRRDPPPPIDDSLPPPPLRVWTGVPPKEDDPLAPRPVYGYHGELLYHPDIPDIDAWRKEQKFRRYWRRRTIWGRICWGWFFVVMSYLCLADGAKRWPDDKVAELDAYVRKMMMIASAPVAVRGFWHRIQWGE